MTPNPAVGPIRVTPARRIHILDGDATGGGHGPGRGVRGKSRFPDTMTDDDIIDGVVRIANDPSSYPGGAIPVRGKKIKIQGVVQGTPTTVIIDPNTRELITAYPT